MPRYELLVDGRGRARVGSEVEVRAWIHGYREEHAEDDPDATHVQVRLLSRWAWLAGGSLVPRERFFDASE
ncbi:MAG TPA: hypothetical protein VMS63_09090 [Gaiellaceae bacterium]|nr:hypothetical protein [Gaiellaceae bacterium]